MGSWFTPLGSPFATDKTPTKKQPEPSYNSIQTVADTDWQASLSQLKYVLQRAMCV